jgi:hypothetical protein
VASSRRLNRTLAPPAEILSHSRYVQLGTERAKQRRLAVVSAGRKQSCDGDEAASVLDVLMQKLERDKAIDSVSSERFGVREELFPRGRDPQKHQPWRRGSVRSVEGERIACWLLLLFNSTLCFWLFGCTTGRGNNWDDCCLSTPQPGFTKPRLS